MAPLALSTTVAEAVSPSALIRAGPTPTRAMDRKLARGASGLSVEEGSERLAPPQRSGVELSSPMQTSKVPEAHSSVRGVRALRHDDLAWIFEGLDSSDHDHFGKPSFAEDCKRRFRELDVDDSGFVETGELATAMANMFPTLQMELVAGDRIIPAPANDVPCMVATFDDNHDGRISAEEFPSLMKFCAAWRRRQYRTVREALHLPDTQSWVHREQPKVGGKDRDEMYEIIRRGDRLPGGRALFNCTPPPVNCRSPIAPNRETPKPRFCAKPLRSSAKLAKEACPSTSLASNAVLEKNASPSLKIPSTPARRKDIHSMLRLPKPRWTHASASAPCSPASSKERTDAGQASKPSMTLFTSAPSLTPSSRHHRTGSQSPMAYGTPRSRSPSPRSERRRTYHERQLEALVALVDEIGGGRDLGDIVRTLVRTVVKLDGTLAFSQEAIDSAVTQTQSCARLRAAPLTPAELPPTTASTLSASAPSGLLEVPMASEQAAQDAVLPPGRGGSVVAVLQILADSSPLPLHDIVGQILWRNKRAEPLQRRRHRATVEDMSWCGDAGECVEDVFKLCTSGGSGRMRRAEWLKIVKVLRKNPVLGPRIRSTDADRLFHSMTMRNGDPYRTVSYEEYLELMLMLAETCGAHPWHIYTAVGCRAENMKLTAAGALGAGKDAITADGASPP